MTPSQKDESKRQRIIEAALKVFAEVGVSNGKIATIAQKAGVGKGTVYEYFSSKEEIFMAVFKSFFTQMISGYESMVQQSMGPVEKISLMLDYTYDFLDNELSDINTSDWLIFLEIFLQGFRDEIHGDSKLSFTKMIHSMYQVFKPVIEEGIASGVFKPLDSEHITFIIFAAIDGIGLHYYLNHKYYDKETLKKITKDIFLNGLLKSQTEGD